MTKFVRLFGGKVELKLFSFVVNVGGVEVVVIVVEFKVVIIESD